jgi:integrase
MDFQATDLIDTDRPCDEPSPGMRSDPEFLNRLIAQSKAAALADNTRSTYRTGWSSWARWAAENGVTAFPASPGHLQGWLASLWQQGKKPATLRTYLAAVDHEHRDRAGDNPAQHPEVRRLMSGICRQAAADGYQPNQAKPLRRSHIQQIIRHAQTQLAQAGMRPHQQQKTLADIAMIALAHDALLRCSELLALRWADVSRSEETETGRALIRRSKTDQTGQGAVCPISADTLEALERMRPPNAQQHQAQPAKPCPLPAWGFPA